MKPVLVWLRRDLRIADQPALLAAAGSGRPVVPVFVVDPLLWDAAGSPRRDRLAASLRSLSADLQARYAVDSGKARRELGYRTRPLEETIIDTTQWWLEHPNAGGGKRSATPKDIG